MAITLGFVAALPALALYGLARDADQVGFKPPEPPSAATTTGLPTTTTPTTMQAGVKVDLAQPFVGTPAAGWSDGAAGVVVPPASAVNGFTAMKVGEALKKARDAFIASKLDLKVIQDGDVELLAGLFAPDMSDQVRTSPDYRTRIAPGFKLLPVPMKVNGQMSVEPGDKGELVIRANYAVAYAFHIDNPNEIRDVMDIVAVVRSDHKYVFREGATFARSSQGLWLNGGHTTTYSMACTPLKEGLLAPAYSERRLGLPGQGESVRERMFDPNAPMPEGNTC
ncbi:hypothetical protein JOF56_004996 [Kibdelosporangium banguiense]|uniref:Uncharacterized protein n=1 Tax=Kibdelosporangium banguiense TaxID=1365924 RepID=A0ABS4TL60_9PSEU|nr:hypothetical protein [Kibdelosporangium banguiense]MBP2324611.1 hypothetical protein [Kibdelosporangium banguiense]